MRSPETNTENQAVAGQPEPGSNLPEVPQQEQQQQGLSPGQHSQGCAKPAHSPICVTGCRRTHSPPAAPLSHLLNKNHSIQSTVSLDFRAEFINNLKFPFTSIILPTPLPLQGCCSYQVWVRWESKQYGPMVAPLQT